VHSTSTTPCLFSWPQGVKRTSNLQAPTMQLTGHAGEVTSLCFSPDGTVLASGSYDRTILFWRTFGECENYMMVRGHKNVVLELHWFSSGDALVSCSADKSVRCWDAHSGEQVKRLREHTAVVNSCSPLKRGPQLIVSGADDGVIKVRAPRALDRCRGAAALLQGIQPPRWLLLVPLPPLPPALLQCSPAALLHERTAAPLHCRSVALLHDCRAPMRPGGPCRCTPLHCSAAAWLQGTQAFSQHSRCPTTKCSTAGGLWQHTPADIHSLQQLVQCHTSMCVCLPCTWYDWK
jgi:hypothetical protein